MASGSAPSSIATVDSRERREIVSINTLSTVSNINKSKISGHDLLFTDSTFADT